MNHSDKIIDKDTVIIIEMLIIPNVEFPMQKEDTFSTKFTTPLFA